MFHDANAEAAELSLTDKRRLVKGKIEQLDKQARWLYFWIKCIIIFGVLSHNLWLFLFCCLGAYPLSERAYKLTVERDKLSKQFKFLM